MDNNHLIGYKIFRPFENLKAFTTTKMSFQKTGVRFTGDEESIYAENRRYLAGIIEISEKQLVFPRQTHSSTVCHLDAVPEIEISDTDALVTHKTGICLCVQTADCVPILLFDPQKKTIAAVHAGWRGTVGKIAADTVTKMVQEYGCGPQNILAAIGPSIGPGVYEVGDEVTAAVRNSLPDAERALIKRNSGKHHFNLWEANRQVLLESGMLEEHIEILGECSFQHNNKYYSARREGAETGRMVSGIIMF